MNLDFIPTFRNKQDDKTYKNRTRVDSRDICLPNDAKQGEWSQHLYNHEYAMANRTTV